MKFKIVQLDELYKFRFKGFSKFRLIESLDEKILLLMK